MTDQSAITQEQYQSLLARVSALETHRHTGVDSLRVRFLSLLDTPDSYYQDANTSYAGATVKVNSTATGLTFGTGGGSYYIGQVTSNAAGAIFPSGWSLTYVSGPPYYQINHTLGSTPYVVLATIKSAAGTPITAQWYPDSSSSFRIYANSSSTGAGSYDFFFAVFT